MTHFGVDVTDQDSAMLEYKLHPQAFRPGTQNR